MPFVVVQASSLRENRRSQNGCTTTRRGIAYCRSAVAAIKMHPSGAGFVAQDVNQRDCVTRRYSGGFGSVRDNAWPRFLVA